MGGFPEVGLGRRLPAPRAAGGLASVWNCSPWEHSPPCQTINLPLDLQRITFELGTSGRQVTQTHPCVCLRSRLSPECTRYFSEFPKADGPIPSSPGVAGSLAGAQMSRACFGVLVACPQVCRSLNLYSNKW